MKKLLFIVVPMTILLTSCENTLSRRMGGSMTIDLPQGKSWLPAHGREIIFGTWNAMPSQEKPQKPIHSKKTLFMDCSREL